MKKTVFLFFIIIFSISLYADNYALFNSQGKQLTNFEYEQIHPFFNDFALCKKDRKFGYINTLGQVIIPIFYTKGEYFYNNTTKVSHNNTSLYINKENNPIYNTEYNAYTPQMSHIIESYNTKNDFNLLIIEHKGLCGVADRNANIIIPCIYDKIYNCDDNIFLVSKNNLFGYINKENKVIIPIEYERASLFNKDFAIVTKNGSTFVINNQGIPIAKDCDQYYIYSKNLILGLKNDKIGGFDREGKQIINFEYSLNKTGENKYIKHNLMAKENLCFILYKDNKYFLFNERGTRVNYIQTNDITEYKSPYTVISKGKYVVDVFGRLEFDTQKEAKNYVDSLKVKIITKMPDKYSLIKPELSCKILDKNWKEISTPPFEEIKDFIGNSFVAKQNNKFGITDADNNIIIPFDYEDLSNFHSNCAIAKLNNKYGLINKENKPVCDFIYTSIMPFINDFAICEKKGKYGIINSQGKEILLPIYSDIKIFPTDLSNTGNVFFVVKQ